MENEEVQKSEDRGILSPNVYMGWGAGTWIIISIIVIAILAWVYVKFIRNSQIQQA